MLQRHGVACVPAARPAGHRQEMVQSHRGTLPQASLRLGFRPYQIQASLLPHVLLGADGGDGALGRCSHDLAHGAGAHIADRVHARQRCPHPRVGANVAPLIELDLVAEELGVREHADVDEDAPNG